APRRRRSPCSSMTAGSTAEGVTFRVTFSGRPGTRIPTRQGCWSRRTSSPESIPAQSRPGGAAYTLQRSAARAVLPGAFTGIHTGGSASPLGRESRRDRQSGAEGFSHRRMQAAVGREYRRRIERHILARQVGEGAAGFAHDDRQGGDVEDVDVGLDDDIEGASRQEMVMDEVAVAADAADAADQ